MASRSWYCKECDDQNECHQHVTMPIIMKFMISVECVGATAADAFTIIQNVDHGGHRSHICILWGPDGEVISYQVATHRGLTGMHRIS